MIYTRNDGSMVFNNNGFPCGTIEGDEFWDNIQQRILDGEPTEQYIPPMPFPDMIWNAVTEEWEYDLSTQKTTYKEQVTTERERRLEAGFTLGVHTIRADNYSQTILQMKYVRLGDSNLTFPFDWRTKENVYYTIPDEATFRVLVSAFNTFVSGVYQDNWDTKDAIESATTIEEVETLYGVYING